MYNKQPQQPGRRRFLAWLTGGAPSLATIRSRATPQYRRILIQRAPLAGFQYHHGESLWPQLRAGDELSLVREPDNRYDERAVRVAWRGYKRGYIPRRENTAVAQMLDRGQRFDARIVHLNISSNPWDRIEFEVWLTS